jgi:hypothetical protein
MVPNFSPAPDPKTLYSLQHFAIRVSRNKEWMSDCNYTSQQDFMTTKSYLRRFLF